MPSRLAAILALIAFAVCLFTGGWQADNTFATTVLRSLGALAGTFAVGLVVGHMVKKMLDENLGEKLAQVPGKNVNQTLGGGIAVPVEKPNLNPKPPTGR